MEFLHVAVSGERAAIVDVLRIAAEGRAHGVRNVGAGHADAERLGGLDGGDGVLREAGHGAQPVRPCCEDARRGAEDVEQARGKRSGVAAGMVPGQQQLEEFAVIDGLAPGVQEPGLEPAADGDSSARSRIRCQGCWRSVRYEPGSLPAITQGLSSSRGKEARSRTADGARGTARPPVLTSRSRSSPASRSIWSQRSFWISERRQRRRGG